MRDYLDAILSFISSESLTDEEYGLIEIDNTNDSLAVYEALLHVLESRESGETMTFRLQNYFLAQGIQVVDVNQLPNSNIFIGDSLE